MKKITIKNTEKYLTPNIVQQCFIKGKVTNVDKQICGNGFSTAFLNLTIEEGKVNIIIAPNKAVLIEKQNTYLANRAAFKNRVKFFFKESKDEDFSNANVLFFVADSFLLMGSKIANITHKIDKVLIDEAHSTEQQTAFRYKLLDFEYKVKKILRYQDISIVKVTATPNLFSKIDIVIDNTLIAAKEISRTRDRSKAVERIKADIKNKENIVVFTNSATLIYHLRNYKNIIKANFVVGENLKRNLVELATIVQDGESNLTIASSRGFEGFDIYYEDAKVYYFEDRSNEYESFYISNLYQAISRTRKGAKYIEYCRQDLNNKRTQHFEDIDISKKKLTALKYLGLTPPSIKSKGKKNIDLAINDFIADDFKNSKGELLSIENKQRSEYKKYKPYLIFDQDAAGVYSVKRNDVAIDLYKEKLLFDKPFPSNEFRDFMTTRKVSVNDAKDVSSRLTKKVKIKQKIKNLFNNKDLIENEGLFNDDYTLDIIDLHSPLNKDDFDYRAAYLKQLERYLRRKDYNNFYLYSEREEIALNLLKDQVGFNKLVSKITKAYNARSIKKYGKVKSRDYRERFKIESSNTVGLLIMVFTNRRIYVPSKWIANRNYNLFTPIGVDEIQMIADVFNTKVLEIDIISCYPRIAYALCGKTLPDNFYGPNKINKVKINTFINNFFYNEKLATKKSDQIKNSINKFKELGFDKDVMDYLMNRFFMCKHRGDLFANISFYERKIITSVREACNLDNEGIVRRHDSILVFNNKCDLSFVNGHHYLDVGGWFNVRPTPVIEMPKIDAEDVTHEALFAAGIVPFLD